MKYSPPNQPMLKPIIIPKIIQYIKCSAQWHALGEPTPIDDGPGLAMSELEEEILTSFGLPCNAFCYSNIMQQQGFDDKDADHRAELLYERLIHEAETFLLSPAKSATEMLKSYKENWTMAPDALPFLGFDFTRYTGFLYHDIYLREICNEEELLQHLKSAKEFCLTKKVYIPFEFEALFDEPIYKQLEDAGLPYLTEYLDYLLYIANTNEWDLDTSYLPPQNIDQVDDELILTEFYICRIEIFNEDSVSIEVMISEEDNFQTITLWCELEKMNYLLRFASYVSMVTHLQISDDHWNVITCPYEYNMFKNDGRNHEINRCQIRLERFIYKKNDPDPFHYQITEIIPHTKVVKEVWDEIDDLPF